MVLDEPTTGLDYGNEVRLLHVVSELVAGGATVLMTTHQPNHALTWATELCSCAAVRCCRVGLQPRS